jgi:hypothetical protein
MKEIVEREIKDPCDLVNAILDNEEGSVEKLLQVAKQIGDEVEWLELKTSLLPPNGKHDQNEGPDDLSWNITEAIIEISNTIGGVVILGIDDKLNPIGIKASMTPNQIKSNFSYDNFINDVLYPVLKYNNDNAVWNIYNSDKKRKEIKDVSSTMYPIINTRIGKYKDIDVLIIFVKPNSVEKLIEVTTIISGNSKKEKKYPSRLLWGTGRINNLTKSSLDSWDEIRAKKNEEVKNLFIKFLNLSEKKAEENFIESYIKGFKTNYQLYKDFYVELDAALDMDFSIIENYNFNNDVEDNFSDFVIDNSENENPPQRSCLTVKIRKERIFNIFETEKQVIIYGCSGSGKTSSLISYAYLKMKEYEKNKVLPIYLKAGDISHYQSLINDICDISKLTEKDVIKLLKDKKIIILIDGYNESKESEQEKLVNELKKLLKEYYEVKIIISTRNDANFNSLRQRLNFTVYRMIQLDEIKQKSILEKYVPGRSDDILKSIKKKQIGTVIIKSPYFLRLLASKANKDCKVPENISYLHRLVIRDWIEREQKKMKGFGFQKDYFKDLVNYAYSSYTENSNKEINFTSIRKRIDITEDEFKSLSKLLEHHDLFEINYKLKLISVSHESIVNYLVAEAVLKNPLLMNQILEDQNVVNTGLIIKAIFELTNNMEIGLLEKIFKLYPVFTTLYLKKMNIDFNSINIIKNKYIEKDYINEYEVIEFLHSYRSQISVESQNLLIDELLKSYFIEYIESAFGEEYLNTIRKYLIDSLGIINACKIVDAGIVEPQCFKKKIPRWLKRCKLNQALQLKNSGIISREDIINNNSLITKANPKEAKVLIEFGLAKKDDFINHSWILKATPESALNYIENGIANIMFFRECDWIKSAKPLDAKRFVEMGIAYKAFFKPLVNSWRNKSANHEEKEAIEYFKE